MGKKPGPAAPLSEFNYPSRHTQTNRVALGCCESQNTKEPEWEKPIYMCAEAKTTETQDRSGPIKNVDTKRKSLRSFQ